MTPSPRALRRALRGLAPLALTTALASPLGSLVACSSDDAPDGGCTKDTDCAAGRVCGDDGRCIAQTGSTSSGGGAGATTTASGASTTASTTGTTTTSTGTGSGTTAASSGSGVMCDGGMTACDGICVDTNIDVKNCGMCGKACPGMSPLCASGVCAPPSQGVALLGGSQRGRIEVAPINSLINAPMTVEAWIKMDAPSDYATFFNTGGRFRMLYAGSTGYGAKQGKFTAFDEQSKKEVFSASPFPIGAWAHVAATYDGSSISLWLNGKLEGTMPWSGGMIDGQGGLANSGMMQFGSTPRADNEAMKGTFDELRLSAGVLYTQAFVPPTHLVVTPSTRALYRFDQGSGVLVNSDLPGGPTATLVGMSSTPGWAPVDR